VPRAVDRSEMQVVFIRDHVAPKLRPCIAHFEVGPEQAGLFHQQREVGLGLVDEPRAVRTTAQLRKSHLYKRKESNEMKIECVTWK